MSEQHSNTLISPLWQSLVSDPRLVDGRPLLEKALACIQQDAVRTEFPRLSDASFEISYILLCEMDQDAETMAAVTLKDLFDKSRLSLQQVIDQYSPGVGTLLMGLQKIDRFDTRKAHTNVENFIKLLLTSSDDIRVILIRIAQRLYALRHIEEVGDEQQADILIEANMLYLPITHRIGLYRLKTEFEERIMRYSKPDIFQSIEQKLAETHADRDRFTRDFIRPIEETLVEHGFKCEIRRRTKSIPSIYRKMQAQKVEFEKVYDLFAIRIILDEIVESEKADCWKIYSLVTDIYTPNPRRLRDWISFPKSTGYESLHSTVIGPDGRWVEVQIRTRRMDEVAEKGVAAHWKYKSAGKDSGETDLFTAIREMLETPVNNQGVITNKEKRALYSDEIFIFTPKGDLKRLKNGYTVLDFAFEVHTTIGHTCTGAIVNGKIVPLKYILRNGDTVKILTSKNQKPNSGWLEFVRSPRNIARVKHALKMEQYKDADLGKEIIKNKVLQLEMEFSDLVIQKLVDGFECENYLELYQKFGEGRLDPLKIKKVLLEQKPSAPVVAHPSEEHFPETMSKMISVDKEFLIIDNRHESFHYQFAKCCKPVPGNKIFAFVSVYQGVKIHRTDCPNSRQLIMRYPYRILEARWKEGLAKETVYPVKTESKPDAKGKGRK
ncbi:MAG: TGS domain-containing protein [Bacteroidetes bacterium]|nr:TGS domain-containing protein [Bacteroidota bacterium]